MKTIKPASKQVFAKPTETEKKTKSGFLLSDNAVERPRTAEAINIGADINWIKAKDTIVYKPYTTTEIKLDDQEYFLIHEEDILGVVIDQ